MRLSRSTSAVRALGSCATALALLAAPTQVGANPQPRNVALTPDDVAQIVQQAVGEAEAIGDSPTVAVVDRVGNVLAVYQTFGAMGGQVTIDPKKDVNGRIGLADKLVPAAAAAIAKAITGAYLSSNGNAFSTRTASQIVQENFNPGSEGLESGPLFGVQFSSLPCSDLVVRFASNNGGARDRRVGPKRSPLGLSADPGGFPLYKQGVLVGAVGAIADGDYGLDRDINNQDYSHDEVIALAGSHGYEAPDDLRADRITVDGRTLRFSDVGDGDLRSDPRRAGNIDLSSVGRFVPVRGYYDGRRPLGGEAFGFGASGYRPARGEGLRGGAYVLTTAGGANRFPLRNGRGLRADDVRRILNAALGVAFDGRAQIRRPLDSHIEVTVSVVDTDGRVVGIARTPDAPVFGTDVSLQKARTAMFFSNPNAPRDLSRAPRNRIGYAPRSYIPYTRDFLGSRSLDGSIAYSARAIGDIAQPFYPSGQNGNGPGPLSVGINEWSIFNTGLQTDLIDPNLLEHLGFVGGRGRDTRAECAGLPRLANGMQIFAGGFPIYRDDTLVGGVGVSGDGIDQDDMVGFLGLDRAGGGVGNAPSEMRADHLSPQGVNLRYVNCPFAPFLNSHDQNVCEGK